MVRISSREGTLEEGRGRKGGRRKRAETGLHCVSRLSAQEACAEASKYVPCGLSEMAKPKGPLEKAKDFLAGLEEAPEKYTAMSAGCCRLSFR